MLGFFGVQSQAQKHVKDHLVFVTQGWKLHPEGAQRAASITRRSTSSGTGVSLKARIERRVSTASATSMNDRSKNSSFPEPLAKPKHSGNRKKVSLRLNP